VAGDRDGCAESSAGGQDAQPRDAGRAAAQASLRRRREQRAELIALGDDVTQPSCL